MFDKKINKLLGFGLMRLPLLNNGKVDDITFANMVKIFMDNGFNYFDTAHGYLNGESEKAFKRVVASNYDRESYFLVNKLTDMYFRSNKDIRPFFFKQLELCGVSYFDLYLMHSQTKSNYPHFKKCGAYEEAIKLKKEGYIKHFGISFHDDPLLLEEILNDYPQIEVVQIQFNYVDYNDSAIQAKKVYETCLKYNKYVIVMEPLKGGTIVRLNNEAQKILDDLNNGSNASYGIRFAASFKNVITVLSGMSNIEQMLDNISFMKDFKPLNDKEYQALEKINQIIRSNHSIACTSCKYCLVHCPKHIKINDLFSCYNQKILFNDWNSSFYYTIHTQNNNKAKDCIKCGSCQKFCPQHLQIPKLLEIVSKEFDY